MKYMLTINGLSDIDKSIKHALAHNIKSIELMLSEDEIISLDDIHYPTKLQDLTEKFLSNNIAIKGIALNSDFSMDRGIMIAKKCVVILKKINASNMRLVYNKVDSILDSSSIIGFINSVGRYASYDADSKRTVIIGYDLYANKNCNFPTINCMVRKHISGCLGVGLDSSTVNNNDLDTIATECNGFEFNINSVVLSDKLGYDHAESFIKKVSYAFDGIVSLNVSPENVTIYKDLIDKYSFDDTRVDYLKLSYPSSVCRYFTDQGSATLYPNKDIVAGETGTYSVTYTVGNRNIEVNGGLKFTLHHSTDWQKLSAGNSKLNLTNPETPSYTLVKATGDAEISVKQVNEDATVVANVIVEKGKLVKGDKVTITYGANKFGTSAQLFRQYKFPFYIFVDFTGHGNYFQFKNPPTVKILPASAKKCYLVAPSCVKSGEKFNLGIRIEDEFKNEVWGYKNDFTITYKDKLVEYDKVDWHKNGGSAKVYGVVIDSNDVDKMKLTLDDGLSCFSNYIDSRKDAKSVWWGDIHCHLGYMDSVGTTDELYDFAENVSFLDFVCHSEHMDSFSGGRQSSNMIQWEEIRKNANAANRDNEFVSLLGFENSETWDANLYFEDDCDAWHVDSFAKGLFEWAKQHNAIVIPHMTTYPQRNRGYDWDCYDSDVVPAAEIYSCHGSSEYFGCEDFLTNCEPGGYVLEALERGYKLGFIGSGDSHSGMPGNTINLKMVNGLIAYTDTVLTRKGIINAIKKRQTYATNNQRILAYFKVNDNNYGSHISYISDVNIDVEVYGTGTIKCVEVVKNGAVIKTVNPESDKCVFSFDDHNNGSRDTYYYLRVIQNDGGKCWVSPVYIDKK